MNLSRQIGLFTGVFLAGFAAVYFGSPAFFLLGDARESVLSHLKDPDSAQFDNLRVVSRGDSKFVCGFVNAKNSLGGYVGRRQFIYSAQAKTSTLDDGALLSKVGDEVERSCR
jgi:hypothetical protein